MASLFSLQPRRRVLCSPVLQLETVTLPASLQASISRLLVASRLTPLYLHKSTKPMDRLVPHEASHERRKRLRGTPVVAHPSAYDDSVAMAHAITRAPGTLAAKVYVMAEVRRCLGERFVSKSVLDFGAWRKGSIYSV